jgi:hypothetical protein
MKPILLALLLSFTTTLRVISQNYYVINTEGKIYSEGKLLKTGDKLSEDMKLTFSSRNDKLYLLSPEKGNFLITPEKNQGVRLPNWMVTLKEALPESKFYRTASRGMDEAGGFSDIYDLMGFFRDKVMYIEDTKFRINGEKLPLNENNSLFFNSLSDQKKSSQPGYKCGPGFFVLTGIDTLETTKNQYELFYVQSGKKNAIGRFVLEIRSRNSVATELSQFFLHRDENGISPTQIYYEQVLPYIAKAYGNTNPDMIKEIILKDLEIPLQLAD